MRSLIITLAASTAVLLAAGCPFQTSGLTPDGGSTGTGASGGGGSSGSGGKDAGMMGECEPGVVEACYNGPAGTQGTGECKGGMRTCKDDGFWGSCDGEVKPQIENCASGKDEDCNGETGCTGALAWSRTYLNMSDTVGRAVAVGNKAGVLVAGELTGELTVGTTKLTSAGFKDAFAIHLDAAGNVRWAKVFGGATSVDIVTAAAPVGATDFVVAGTFTGSFMVDGKMVTAADGTDSFVMRLDGMTGAVKWAVTLTGQDLSSTQGQYANAVTSDGAGDVIVAGHFSKELMTGNQVLSTPAANAQDLFVIKLDGDTGAPLWMSQISGSVDFDRVSAAGVAVDANDDILVAGGTKQAYTANDVLLYNKSLNTSFPYATVSSSSSVVVAKISDTGIYMWGKSFGGLGIEQGLGASAVAAGPTGDVVIAGGLDGKLSFDQTHELNAVQFTSAGFLATLDGAGAPKTVTRLGDTLKSEARAVSVDPFGNIVVGGVHEGAIILSGLSLAGTQDSQSNGFLIKLDPLHKVLWGKSLGGPNADILNAVASDAYGQSYATGAFVGTISFDGMATINNPNTPFNELFLVKYLP